MLTRSGRFAAVTVSGCLAWSLLGVTGAGAETAFAPDTCASGYVWRGARASDHVCVEPSVRDRTRSENASGVWHACTTGFVWREAYPGDFRCVVPGSRTQARRDNDSAARRLAWVIMVKRNHAGNGPSCDGETCSTTNEGPYQTVAVRGYYLTPGTQVTVQVKRSSDGRVLWQGRAAAQSGGNGPAGSFSVDTGRVLCGGSSFKAPLTAYVVVRGDGGQWSPRVPIAWRSCSLL
ncbi:hypothetical protein OHA25_13865 [Nonomuraea sp. NBC_00507]|uniref:hypothetical protein n=1 Tax=Nonomuraea sp. NBC_00507 TaxID=2976002 RepID=UPI002E186CA3